MLLFTTSLKTKDTFTEDVFLRLLLDWNEMLLETPHPENHIGGIDWHGEHEFAVKDKNLSLTVAESKAHGILAARYEKDADGTIWDTDYVACFPKHTITIRLERSYQGTADWRNRAFTPPLMLHLLIDGGYIEDDGPFPVSETPIVLERGSADLVRDIVHFALPCRLPVLYVAHSEKTEPVDALALARRTRGVAHVVTAKDTETESLFLNRCLGLLEYDGTIGLYMADASISHRKFHASSRQLDKTVDAVIRYANVQQVSELSTWNGVRTTALHEKLQQQANESDELLDAFDDDLTRLQNRITDLEKENARLYRELDLARQQAERSGKKVLLTMGQEKDKFPGEIRDLLLSELERSLKNRRGQQTRRTDVLQDIIGSNHYEALTRQRADAIRKITGTADSTERMVSRLEEYGITKERDDGKHIRVSYGHDMRYTGTIAKTPSDARAGRNLASELIETML